MINDYLSRENQHKRAKSMLEAEGVTAQIHETEAKLPTLKKPQLFKTPLDRKQSEKVIPVATNSHQ